MEVTEQINEKFTIICNECGEADVEVQFYAGFIHDCGGDTGSLSFVCGNCGAGVEVE